MSEPTKKNGRPLGRKDSKPRLKKFNVYGLRSNIGTYICGKCDTEAEMSRAIAEYYEKRVKSSFSNIFSLEEKKESLELKKKRWEEMEEKRELWVSKYQIILKSLEETKTKLEKAILKNRMYLDQLQKVNEVKTGGI